MIIYCNIGLFEIRASTYISAKLKKRTFTHESLQLQLKWTLEAVKLPQLLFLFTLNMICGSTVSINKA